MIPRFSFLLLLFITASCPLWAMGQEKSLKQVCKSTAARGWLYKPLSEDSGPPREGKPLILFPSGKPGKNTLRVFAANGTEICFFRRWPEDTLYGERYYSGTGCNKDSKKLASLARAATAKTGKKSSFIYIEAAKKSCAGPINPSARVDKR